jgi:predicted RNase H-like nuclease (RuvC/YqgF family)
MSGAAKSVLVNHQEHQELKESIEQLTVELGAKDSCIKTLSSKLERLGGTNKVLVSEETIFGSQTAKTLFGQVRFLLEEVEERDN